MEKEITLMKSGTTNKVQWYLLIFGSTAKKVGKVFEISRSEHIFVTKDVFSKLKVGMKVRIVG